MLHETNSLGKFLNLLIHKRNSQRICKLVVFFELILVHLDVLLLINFLAVERSAHIVKLLRHEQAHFVFEDLRQKILALTRVKFEVVQNILVGLHLMGDAVNKFLSLFGRHHHHFLGIVDHFNQNGSVRILEALFHHGNCLFDLVFVRLLHI